MDCERLIDFPVSNAGSGLNGSFAYLSPSDRSAEERPHAVHGSNKRSNILRLMPSRDGGPFHILLKANLDFALSLSFTESAPGSIQMDSSTTFPANQCYV
jgi:hypothetical protein